MLPSQAPFENEPHRHIVAIRKLLQPGSGRVSVMCSTLMISLNFDVFKLGVRVEREIQGVPASLIASESCEVFLDHGA
jgi:hypothetical protein